MNTLFLSFFIKFLSYVVICLLSNRYIGHLKERRLKDQMEKDPTEVIRKAVLRMLPRNRLRDVSETSSILYSAIQE